MSGSLTRRKWLIFSGVGLIAASSALFASWRTAKETDIVVALLRNRLRPLRIAPGVFEQFSVEYIQTRKDYASRLRLLGTFAELFSLVTPYQLLPMGHSWRRMENNIVSAFLLSTDFFQNGARTDIPVNYLGFYDPYRRPCVRFFTS
ncbi:hypothetical protein [Saccharophagus sp. K07]|mgnify:CR=1 FL=1|jgi:hypothetical protein|uniref:hypothetical protein n=1 Tax=Saccharophagus sp. K07 TaxID=2283636 RepID=UPI001651FD8D|nr:hypothetical protein [Saccharophagus sp. K07]